MSLQYRERSRSTKEWLRNRNKTNTSGGRKIPPQTKPLRYRYTGAEIYLKYTILEVGVLGHILESLEEIKRNLVKEIGIKMGHNFEKTPVIYIHSMHTGQSITFNIAGTTITIDPKKHYIIAAIVVGILYTSFKIYNEFKIASAQTEQIELQNKEKKIDIESKKIDFEKKKLAWEKEKDSAAGKLVLYLSENNKITTVRINRRPVK